MRLTSLSRSILFPPTKTKHNPKKTETQTQTQTKMAQPGQLPIHPQIQMPPTTLMPIPGSEPTQSATLKRRREDEYPPVLAGPEPQEPGAKRRAKAQDVIFRIVVPSRQIGKVIGKEGCRIQKIREETKANIKIADAIAVCNSHLDFFSLGFRNFFYCCFGFWIFFAFLQRHEERVIIISSKDSDNASTDAEKALQQIAGLILKVINSVILWFLGCYGQVDIMKLQGSNFLPDSNFMT